MNVIEVEQFGDPETLQLIEEPTPAPKEGQVVIEVRAAGVNFADILIREGAYPPGASAPARPGLEVAGVVSQRGDGVQSSQRGERVMAFVPSGGYADHAVLDMANVYVVPDDLDFGAATPLLVQGLTAYLLLETGQLSLGQTVLVPGAAGGVGSLAVQGKNITLRGYNLYANITEWGRGVEKMLGWATSGKLKIDVTRFPLADAAKAHEAISARQTMGKVVLEP